MSRREYIFPNIVNEVIRIMGHVVQQHILTDFKSTMQISLIVENASNIYNNEHINISIRWVD